jgi:hypothetical protein
LPWGLTLSSRNDSGRISIPIWGGEMIPESEYEKRERQQRELEQMRLAIAAYTGPITKCPAGRTTDPHAIRPFRGRTRRPRPPNGDGR